MSRSLLLSVCACALLLGAVNAGRSNSAASTLRLNAVTVKGTHNSYHVRPPKFLPEWEYSHVKLVRPDDDDHDDAIDVSQLDDLNVNAIELDLWLRPDEQKPNKISVYVRHTPGPNLDSESNYRYLEDALQALKQWSNEHCNHFPIIVHLELKNYPGQYPDRIVTIGRIIRRVLGSKRLSPDDLLALTKCGPGNSQCTTLNQMATSNKWPFITQLLGKFIFVSESMDEPFEAPARLAENGVFAWYDWNDNTQLDYKAFVIMNNPITDGAPETEGGPHNLQRIAVQARAGYFVRTRADADFNPKAASDGPLAYNDPDISAPSGDLPFNLMTNDFFTKAFNVWDQNSDGFISWDEGVSFITDLESFPRPAAEQLAGQLCAFCLAQSAFLGQIQGGLQQVAQALGVSVAISNTATCDATARFDYAWFWCFDFVKRQAPDPAVRGPVVFRSADFDTVADTEARKAAALSSGAHIISTDYPDSSVPGYSFDLDAPVVCNAANPQPCSGVALTALRRITSECDDDDRNDQSSTVVGASSSVATVSFAVAGVIGVLAVLVVAMVWRRARRPAAVGVSPSFVLPTESAAAVQQQQEGAAPAAIALQDVEAAYEGADRV